MRAFAVIALAACGQPVSHAPSDAAGPADAPAPIVVTATVNSTRFVTREHMLAAAEMQISGEPLAESMGRVLASYSRDRLPTDLYFDANVVLSWIDLAGFSAGVESYEYSKQPMNMIAFESGAGTPLAAGPLVTNLAADIQHYAAGSNALGRFVFPTTGWPGMLPTLHVFASFDPAIDPTSHVGTCAITSDDDPDGMLGGQIISTDYECDATSLHLRETPDPTISPGADGFSGWKYALWTLNYLQTMHDQFEAPVYTAGFLGSSDIEGFQAQLFIAMLDNRAADWLGALSTTDGTTLSGFANPLAYDYASPLRWFPHAISNGAITDPSSDGMDLVGLALAYATIYAITDRTNADVGGIEAATSFFDGDPFSQTGLRDRALAMIRVAWIDFDRMHVDPATSLVYDRSPTTLAYTLIALRTTLRSLNGQLELYSNNTPDTAIGTTPLDIAPRLTELLKANAELLYAQPVAPTLDAYTATIRGLFAAYLATSDTRFRDRAIELFDQMDTSFYDHSARIYASVPGLADDVEFTPLRFALLQSTLRDMYELVATRPGGEARIAPLEDRLARLDKLVLNGWDDRDANRLVDWPAECVNVVAGMPRGGLQMAERTLTGELGTVQVMPGDTTVATSDREHDCVPEIDDAHLPAALADSVTFHIQR